MKYTIRAVGSSAIVRHLHCCSTKLCGREAIWIMDDWTDASETGSRPVKACKICFTRNTHSKFQAAQSIRLLTARRMPNAPALAASPAENSTKAKDSQNEN